LINAASTATDHDGDTEIHDVALRNFRRDLFQPESQGVSRSWKSEGVVDLIRP
jgi:hypothetical protein